MGELSARLDTLWDNEALYLRVRVDDHTPWTPTKSGTNFWTGDSVQFRFRTGPAAAGGQVGGQGGGQAQANAADANVLHLSWYPFDARGTVAVNALRGQDLSQVDAGVDVISSFVTVEPDAGYTLLSRVPWRFIDPSFRPRPGNTLRLALLVNSGDILTDEWVDGVSFNNALDFLNPDAWGPAMLLGGISSAR